MYIPPVRWTLWGQLQLGIPGIPVLVMSVNSFGPKLFHLENCRNNHTYFVSLLRAWHAEEQNKDWHLVGAYLINVRYYWGLNLIAYKCLWNNLSWWWIQWERKHNLQKKTGRKFTKVLFKPFNCFDGHYGCNLIFVFSEFPSINTSDFHEFTKKKERKEEGGRKAWSFGLTTISSSP